ncbi:lipid A biosynthesis (KDO)2-(lauroyl)-lipid IVA acyltransferase [Enterovibrio norvegicus]|uniref:Lipid A biosynthesis acyltransferase n=1 Tax=Enterovibrio norvegicus TaxID=188144 RepID=A0A2N7LEA3_9GAMM|nr:lipid A biosynthesis (KDO)2-(lauroyl)-lipid IVA acyltransferase [Enterovibrio norvegicus]PML79729.1 lauroyl acyltransferase [Enterovibrio norvegicus]PMN69831.1 lauroyl acyltransferase [Enterovibrio norvegicus]PMN93736.1 lauroyl acyltransferase [Enterovibrio norvegicus]
MSPEPIDKNTYNPTFSWSYLLPRYWTTWLAVIFGAVFTLLPHFVHKAIAKGLSRIVCLSKSGSVHRTRVNLSLCFPEASEAEREQMLKKQFAVAICYLLKFPSITLKSRKWLQKNVVVSGEEQLIDTKQNTILLVPHTWSIDVPAIYLASRGLPVAAFAKKQKNGLSDWLMHRQRVQYGGAVCERKQGIKPFIKAVRGGYLGYYLPDEDLGEKHSVFVDFFATTKATLSGLNKLAKVSQARIVPLYAKFNLDSGRYEIKLYEPITLSGDEWVDARLMNQFIENQVVPEPEQYMWILRLLKTRQNGEKNPYK